MSRNNKSFWYYIGMGVLWTIGISAVGLYQYFLLSFVTHISANPAVIERLHTNLRDGFIVFFCVGLSGSVLVEFVMPKNFRIGIRHALLLIGIPFVLNTILTVLYLVVVLDQAKDKSLLETWPSSIFIVIFSILYSIFAKAYFYMRDNNRDEEPD